MNKVIIYNGRMGASPSPLVSSSDERFVRNHMADLIEEVSVGEFASSCASGIRDGRIDGAVVEDIPYEISSHPAENVREEKTAALAAHLGVCTGEVHHSPFGTCSGAFDVRTCEYRVLTDIEAQDAAHTYIRESVWLFSPGYLAHFVIDDFEEAVIEMIQQDMGSEANPAILALIEAGSGFEVFADDAIETDGRGHFLSPYDRKEVESGGFLVYRVN